MEKEEKIKIKNVLHLADKKVRNWAIALSGLCVLLMIFCVFLLFNEKKPEPVTNTESTTEPATNIQPDEQALGEQQMEHDGDLDLDKEQNLSNLTRLNPIPNDTLKNSKGKILKIAVKQGDSIAQVVKKRIIDVHKNDIAEYYRHQKDDYIKYLIENNKDCFITQKETCECDTLRVIPCYKPR